MAQLPSKLRFAFTPSGGYKAGALYPIVPNDNVGNFDVVRNSIGTRVNKDGLIEVMDANVPRLDYLDGGCPKLLTEVSSTNALPYSEDFSQGDWAKTNVTATSGFPSPKGDDSAYKIDTITQGAEAYLQYTTSSMPSNLSYTASIFVKKDTASRFFLRPVHVGESSSTSQVNFDFNEDGKPIWDGVLGGLARGVSVSKTNINDFYRVSVSFAIGSPTVTLSGFRVQLTSGVSNSIFIFGAMQETFPTLSSYIPTYGATVTRNADQVINAGDSSTFNSQSGVLFADVKVNVQTASLDSAVGISNNNGSNEIINIILRGDGNVQGWVTDSSNQADMRQSYDILVQNKYSIRYANNDFSLWINGIKFVTDNSGSVPSVNKLGLSSYGNANFLKGKTKSIQHYDYLSDLEMEQLTGYDSYSAMTSQFNFNVL